MILHSVRNIYPHLNKRDNDKYLWKKKQTNKIEAGAHLTANYSLYKKR